MSDIIRWTDETISKDAKEVALEMLIDYFHGEAQVHEDEGDIPDEIEHLEAIKGAIQTLSEINEGKYLLVKVEDG